MIIDNIRQTLPEEKDTILAGISTDIAILNNRKFGSYLNQNVSPSENDSVLKKLYEEACYLYSPDVTGAWAKKAIALNPNLTLCYGQLKRNRNIRSYFCRLDKDHYYNVRGLMDMQHWERLFPEDAEQGDLIGGLTNSSYSFGQTKDNGSESDTALAIIESLNRPHTIRWMSGLVDYEIMDYAMWLAIAMVDPDNVKFTTNGTTMRMMHKDKFCYYNFSFKRFCIATYINADNRVFDEINSFKGYFDMSQVDADKLDQLSLFLGAIASSVLNAEMGVKDFGRNIDKHIDKVNELLDFDLHLEERFARMDIHSALIHTDKY